MTLRIVILTGAGISAESGLSTFRDKDGLWSQYDLKEVATPEGFARNPDLVHEFYNLRRRKCQDAQPNAAHFALARLQANFGGTTHLITQNVDDLHTRAGSLNVLHMHGVLKGALCADCGHRWPAPLAMHRQTPCPSCRKPFCRPDIVWFGEQPYQLDHIWTLLAEADLFVAIGTSGNVHPAAGFAQMAARFGARRLELNLEATPNAADFTEQRQGQASQIVPQWVDEILAG